MANTNHLLSVRDLVVEYTSDGQVIHAVNGVSFDLEKGKTIGLVGETGAGKTTIAKSILRILPDPPARIRGGEIFYQGRDLMKASELEMRSIRGNQISMIFQEPMTSLNPVYTIGQQITESIRLHMHLSKKDAEARAVELLRKVQIPDAEKRLKTYPHQLSGGMRQRVMICMALSCAPKLLIADEPTTALDVTIQAQILDLIRSLSASEGTSVLFITHDLGVVAEIAQRAIVMYAGSIMEMGEVRTMFQNPLHPYTQGLLSAIPKLSMPHGEKLYTIRGIVPDLSTLPKGCVFSTRCDKCMSICREKRPPLRELEDGRRVRCFLMEGGKVVGE